jgi:hypothetical protein
MEFIDGDSDRLQPIPIPEAGIYVIRQDGFSRSIGPVEGDQHGPSSLALGNKHRNIFRNLHGFRITPLHGHYGRHLLGRIDFLQYPLDSIHQKFTFSFRSVRPPAETIPLATKNFLPSTAPTKLRDGGDKTRDHHLILKASHDRHSNPVLLSRLTGI